MNHDKSDLWDRNAQQNSLSPTIAHTRPELLKLDFQKNHRLFGNWTKQAKYRLVFFMYIQNLTILT